MATKQIATSTLWQIGSQLVMAAFAVLSAKFVAIGLSKELAGAYNSAYGYLQIFAILADFGLYAVSVKEASAATDKGRVLGALLVLRTIITLLSLGAGVLIAWLIPTWQGTPLSMGVSIAAFVPFFTLLAGILRTGFQIRYKMHLVFIAEVSQRVLTATLMAALIFTGVRLSSDPKVYAQFLWIGSAGAFLLFTLSTIFTLRVAPVRPCFDKRLLKKLLKHAAPYGAAFLCIAFYRQFDLTLIALLRNDFQIQNAEYGFALRVSEMANLVPTFLLNSTLPLLSERQAKGENTRTLLGKTLLITLLLCSTAALFCLFWSRPLMQLLTTDAYLSSVLAPGSDSALLRLSATVFFNGIVLFSFYILLARHRWKPLVASMLLAVAISLGLNLVLIPDFGFIGATITSAIVHVVLSVLLFPQALKAMPLSFPNEYAVRLVLYVLILAAALALTGPFLTMIPLTVVACVVMGSCVIALAYGLGFKDLLFLPKSPGDQIENV